MQKSLVSTVSYSAVSQVEGKKYFSFSDYRTIVDNHRGSSPPSTPLSPIPSFETTGVYFFGLLKNA